MERTFLRASLAANTRMATPKRDPFPLDSLRPPSPGNMVPLYHLIFFSESKAPRCLVEYCLELRV